MSLSARMLIGWKEWVALPALGLPAIKAKVDTGARTSSLHAFELETFERAGALHVRFRVHPLRGRAPAGTHPISVVCEAKVIDHRFVSDSGGHRERRYVIETDLVIGEFAFPIEVTLANREAMSHRMLIGRTAMKYLMIDPSHRYMLGKPEKIRALYEKPKVAIKRRLKKKKATAKGKLP